MLGHPTVVRATSVVEVCVQPELFALRFVLVAMLCLLLYLIVKQAVLPLL